MSAKGFILFMIVTSFLSLSIVFSILGSLIWRAFGNYILILLAGWLAYKIYQKAKKIKASHTPNA
jgi:NhaP-type Na+/H+ or K+/H+ antiporter